MKQEEKDKLLQYKNKYVVYQITFPNDKKYIGFSSNIIRRWKGPSEYSSQLLISRAIAKYGWENLIKEVIFVSDDKQTALSKEAELIEKYNLLNSDYGYNMVPGGGDPPHNTYNNLSDERKQEWKEKHRQMAIRQWQNPEQAELLKRRMKEECHKSRMQKTPTERKEIWGKHNIGRIPPNAKPVLQIDLQTGEILNEYQSASQAARMIGKDNCASANIRRTANGIGKSAYGYAWRWKNE